MITEAERDEFNRLMRSADRLFQAATEVYEEWSAATWADGGEQWAQPLREQWLVLNAKHRAATDVAREYAAAHPGVAREGMGYGARSYPPDFPKVEE